MHQQLRGGEPSKRTQITGFNVVGLVNEGRERDTKSVSFSLSLICSLVGLNQLRIWREKDQRRKTWFNALQTHSKKNQKREWTEGGKQWKKCHDWILKVSSVDLARGTSGPDPDYQGSQTGFRVLGLSLWGKGSKRVGEKKKNSKKTNMDASM